MRGAGSARSRGSDLRSRLQRLIDDHSVRGDERTVTEPGTDEVRSVFEVHALEPAFDELLRDPRVADVARQILDSDVYLHQSRVNVKPGFRGNGFWWHSAGPLTGRAGSIVLRD